MKEITTTTSARTWEKPNTSHGWTCPICGTNEEKEIVLLPIDGTQEDNICQAEQVHFDCIMKQLHAMRMNVSKGDVIYYMISSDRRSQDHLNQKENKTNDN